MKCVNCAMAFNKESYAPRILGCGHTFCHSCMSALLDCGELQCPTCELKMSIDGVEDLPLNRSLLEFIVEEGDKKIPKECLCAFHKKLLKSFCNKCGDCTCPECYKELHNKEFGCDEVCFSDVESNLKDSAIVENLNDKIKTFTEELDEIEEEIQSAKKFETSFKECYWSLSQYRKYLEVNCEHIKDNLSSFEASKSSLRQCSSESEFMDCCKGLFPLKSHPQTARGIKRLKPLVDSRLRKNFVAVQLAFIKKLHTENLADPDSSSATVVLKREATSAHVSLIARNRSFSLCDNDSMLHLFKEFNSKNIRKFKLSWPLNAIEGKESKNLGGKSVNADIELYSKDQVETFYKIFSQGKEEEMFTTYNGENIIELKSAKSISQFCFWDIEGSEEYACDDEIESSEDLILGLNTDEVASNNYWNWKLPNNWPVYALVSAPVPEFVLVKHPIKSSSKSFQLVGNWQIGGDVEDMPDAWQSRSWKLSSNQCKSISKML